MIKPVMASLAALAAGAGLVLFAGTAGAANSYRVAGYFASAPVAFTTFSGSLTAPAATCPATGYVEAEMMMEFYSLTSAENVFFEPVFTCNNGTLGNYTAEAGMYDPSTGISSQGDVSVSPGDKLTFRLTEDTTKGTTVATVTDATTGMSASAMGKLAPSLTQIEVYTSFCGSNGCVDDVSPIPTFTSITYSRLNFGGALLSSFNPTRYNLYDGRTLQVRTTGITATGSFSTVFEHI